MTERITDNILSPKTLRLNQGFTMVELIVVIIVVAIMSLYAASQFIGVSKFSAQAAQEQGISVIRQIQLGRMQSNLDESETLHERHSYWFQQIAWALFKPVRIPLIGLIATESSFKSKI